jgi:ketosteroid isomerase-like protein
VTAADSDRAEILDIVYRADRAATHRDADAYAYVALFADDAVLDGAKGDHTGREAIRQTVGPVWASEGSASAHLTLNATIEAFDGDGATVRSMLLIVSPGPPPSILSVNEIEQTLVRSVTGWLITRRSVAGPA